MENESLLVLPKLEVVRVWKEASKSRYSAPGIVMGGSEVRGTAGRASNDVASGTGSEGVEVDGAGGTSLGSGSSGEC